MVTEIEGSSGTGVELCRMTISVLATVFEIVKLKRKTRSKCVTICNHWHSLHHVRGWNRLGIKLEGVCRCIFFRNELHRMGNTSHFEYLSTYVPTSHCSRGNSKIPLSFHKSVPISNFVVPEHRAQLQTEYRSTYM